MELVLVVNSLRKRNWVLSVRWLVRVDTAPARLAEVARSSRAKTSRKRLLIRWSASSLR